MAGQPFAQNGAAAKPALASTVVFVTGAAGIGDGAARDSTRDVEVVDDEVVDDEVDDEAIDVGVSVVAWRVGAGRVGRR